MNTSSIKWSKVLLEGKGQYYLIILFVSLGVSSLLGYYTPELIKDLASYYEKKELYQDTLINLSILFVAVYLNRSLYNLFVNIYVKDLVQRVRTFCYEKWVRHYDLEGTNDRYPLGEILARIISDTEAIRELITSGTFGILVDIFYVISALVGLISLNTFSGIFLTATEFLCAAILIWGSRYMREIFLEVRNSRGNLYRTVANLVGGTSEMYYVNNSQYASKKGEKVFDHFLDQVLKSNVWDASYYSLAESLYPIFLALLILIFPYSGITQAAIVFSIVDLIQRSISPVKDISGKVANIQRAVTGFSRVSDFIGDLDQGKMSPLNRKGGPIDPKKLVVDIKEFNYPKKNNFHLKDISFTALPGQLVGIVGKSGCGKSTLLNILAGNLTPQSGGVLFEGRDGRLVAFNRDSELSDYREQVGIVSQDSHLFSETLAFNISLGEKIGNLDQFWDWAVSELNYLQKWGLRLDSFLNPKELSLGQKQLLSALRALYLRKPLVLFDEISSALDSDLEMALRKVIKLVQSKSLTFIVAHRLETVAKADQIIVMEKGKIVSRGIHRDLVANSPLYQELVNELT